MKYIYIQGNFLAETKAVIPLAGRAWRFGDGVFETIRVENGKLYNLPFHLKRLRTGLQHLKINFKQPAEKIAAELITKNNLRRGFVRIAVSRQAASQGYLPTGNDSLLVMEATKLSPQKIKNPSLYISSYKAYVPVPAKTMSSLNYTLALLEAKTKACANALLLDQQGNICETASGNIFWFKNGKLYTPAVTLSLIPGSIRERIIKLTKVVEGTFKLSALQAADEIFMTNVNCLVQNFTQLHPHPKKLSMKRSLEIKRLIENDIATQLG